MTSRGLRRSGAVAAETHRHLQGARMPIPVPGTELTRVLAPAVRWNKRGLGVAESPVRFPPVHPTASRSALPLASSHRLLFRLLHRRHHEVAIHSRDDVDADLLRAGFLALAVPRAGS